MAKAKRPYGGVYENMDFPTYEFTEYPKHVPSGAHGKYEIAHTAEEEAEISARVGYKQEVIAQEQRELGPDPQRERLILRARELDVPINRKWSLYKISSLIKEAEESLDALPAEPIDYHTSNSAKVAKPTLVAAKIVDPDDEPAENEEPSKKEVHSQLFKEAKALGIECHHVWGIPRLQSAIAEHKLKNK